jgi:GDPmannose 4,6-dehydratase
MNLNKKILITGISGFVGPYLLKELLSYDVYLYGIDFKKGNLNHPLKDFLKEAEIYEGDLRDKDFVFNTVKKIKPEIVFHLAAKSSVKESFENPYDFFEVNCKGTLNLLEAIKKLDFEVNFLFAGSSDEYGIVLYSKKQYEDLKKEYGEILPKPKKLPELPVNENNPLRPISPYGITKVYGDFLTRTYSIFSNINGIVSRSFNHEGKGRGEGFVTTDIMKQIINVIKGDNEIKAGNIIAMRDWSCVSDVVKAYVLLSKKKSKGEVFNVGSGRTNSVLTFILLSLEVAGFKIEEIEFKNKKIENPIEKVKFEINNFSFETYKIDKLILKGKIKFEDLCDGVIVKTKKKNVKINIDFEKIRKIDIPVLLCDNRKIKKIGFKVNYDLKEIVREMLDYFISLK